MRREQTNNSRFKGAENIIIKKLSVNEAIERFRDLTLPVGVMVTHPLHPGKEFVVFGNCSNDNGNLWCADNETGKSLWLDMKSLKPSIKKQSLSETLKKCIGWAAQGDENAMWWLGYAFETGSSEFEAEPRKALAYYLAAIRKNKNAYGNCFSRIIYDGYNLFNLNPDSEDKRKARLFRKKFSEFDDEPTWGTWEAAIKIADSIK